VIALEQERNGKIPFSTFKVCRTDLALAKGPK